MKKQKTKIEKQKNKFYFLMEKYEKKSNKLNEKWNKIYETFIICNDALLWRKLSYILDKISVKQKYFDNLSKYYMNRYYGIKEYNL